jgi:hypothetical protein
MTALVRTGLPVEEPLALQEVKNHLRVNNDGDDVLIDSLIIAARILCEESTRRALITQQWRLWLDAFPGGEEPWWDGLREGAINGMIRRFIHLPRPPLISVEAVKTYSEDNEEEEFSAAAYFVDTASEPGRLALRNGAAWPVPGRSYNGVRVDFTAGYGGPEDIPAPLKQGMLAHIAHLYENRGDGQSLAGMRAEAYAPHVAIALYQPFRVHHLV